MVHEGAPNMHIWHKFHMSHTILVGHVWIISYAAKLLLNRLLSGLATQLEHTVVHCTAVNTLSPSICIFLYALKNNKLASKSKEDLRVGNYSLVLIRGKEEIEVFNNPCFLSVFYLFRLKGLSLNYSLMALLSYS